MIPTLSSLVALDVDVYYDNLVVASDDKVGTMTTQGF